MEDQENIVQSTTEISRSNISEVKQSLHAASKTNASPKKAGGLKDTANKDYARVDSKALQRTFITSQTKSDIPTYNTTQVKSGISVYKQDKKADVQKKAIKEVVVKKKDVKAEVDSVDQEKLKQEIKQLKQDIKAKTASVSSKKLEKKKLDKAIRETEKEIKEMGESTTREKEAVQELKDQVEQLEAADKEMDDMIASLDKLGTVYELKRQDKQQAIDDLLNTLSELNYDISELKGEP